jgi:hypothetical protein
MSTTTPEAAVPAASTAKAAAKPKGLLVLPAKGKADPAAETGAFMIAQAYDTPWMAEGKEPAVRLIRCAAPEQVLKPGRRTHLTHAKSGAWLGEWKIIAKAAGKLGVWEAGKPGTE